MKKSDKSNRKINELKSSLEYQENLIELSMQVEEQQHNIEALKRMNKSISNTLIAIGVLLVIVLILLVTSLFV